MICLLPLALHSQNIKDIQFNENDHVIIMGNTLAERMNHFGYVESLLYMANPGKKLIVRNLGWSADEITVQPRPLNFGSMKSHLEMQHADVIFLCFGLNESYKGKEGLNDFRINLTKYILDLKEKKINGESRPTLILVSPLAHEDLKKLDVDVLPLNENLKIYSETMEIVAKRTGIYFLDLFNPTVELFSDDKNYTINGIHLNEQGYKNVSEIWFEQLGYETSNIDWSSEAELREFIMRKNQQFFYRWRAVNGEYIYGRRKEPFGVNTFPPEMEKLDSIISVLDTQINATPIQNKLNRTEILLK